MNDTLAERGARYGDFVTHAQITQDLKTVFVASPMWRTLSAAQKESLEMVAHKIGRILNGDPNYADSWHDIVGYAKLVEDLLNDTAGTVVPAEIVGGKPGPVPTLPPYGKSPVKEIEDQIAHVKELTTALEPVKTAALPNVAPVTLPDNNKDGK